MIQAQNVQQQPSQDVREQLYSQLEDYLGLSSTKKKMDSSEKSGGTTLKRKSSEQSSSSSSSKALSKNTLAIKVNGKTIKGSAQNIVGRVVEAEMGASFREEALKAQAVAAYTYIRYNNQKGTIPSLPAKSSVSAKVEDAVEQVIGEALYYQGEYINATYCASNAGNSVDSENVWGGYLPYLRSVESPGDTTLKAYGAVKRFSEEEIAQYIEDNLDVDPYDYSDPDEWFEDEEYINGRYVDSIRVCGRRFSGREVREELMEFALPSAAFEVEYDDGEFIFTTYGYGHGVGMSQQGADYFAQRGWDYEEILTHYYTGVTLK